MGNTIRFRRGKRYHSKPLSNSQKWGVSFSKDMFLYRWIGVSSIFGYPTEYRLLHGRIFIASKGRSVTVW